jgi:hypothetical protein
MNKFGLHLLTNHKPFARIDGTLPSIWMLVLTNEKPHPNLPNHIP